MTGNVKLPIKLRLPDDVTWSNDREEIIKRFSNLGLLYNKYPLIWTEKDKLNEAFQTEFKYKYKNDKGKEREEKVNLKHQFLIELLNNFCNSASSECLKETIRRQSSVVISMNNTGWHVFSFTAATDSRLIIGLGGTSVIETGMTLHPLYGFPYLPGSGIKGLARAYAEIAVEPKPSGAELKEVFGSEDKDPHNVANNRQGKVFFMDGLPTQFPKLELDIMNPHYGDYYSDKKDSKGNLIPPADYLNPVPVTFLAVAVGQKFSFSLYSRDADLLAKAKEWLVGGLTELGAGGKTNVGYGYFKDVQSTTSDFGRGQVVAPLQTAPEKDDSLTARLKLIKNPKTFTDFLISIKDDEIERLISISFKGMESVINIGLLGTLESSEVSEEIKKIIAQKMLEICKEPDKKYAERLKKYQQLQTIAGVDKT
jgi:CRISPR-associated protein Cmr6